MATRTQADGHATIYYTNSNHLPVYLKLPGYEQIVFYWSLRLNRQKQLPILRSTRETIEWAEIVSLDDDRLIVKVEDRKYVFDVTSSTDTSPFYAEWNLLRENLRTIWHKA